MDTLYLLFGLAALSLGWAVAAIHGVYGAKEYKEEHVWPTRSYVAFFLSVLATVAFFADAVSQWRLILHDRGLLIVTVVMLCLAWLLYVLAETGYKSRRRK